MSLRNDQTITEDSVLLGRFIAAVTSVSAEIVDEPFETPNHAQRSALAKRFMLLREAENVGRVILKMAVARNPKLRTAGLNVEDQDIIDVVTHYVDVFARDGW